MIKERKRSGDPSHSVESKKLKTYSSKDSNKSKENHLKYNRNQPNKNENKIEKSIEKKDWAKFKEEKKKLRLERKKSKDYYEILVDLKKLHEKLKCKQTKNKSDLVSEMLSLTNKSIQKLAFSHDTARIIQCMFKYGSKILREKITDLLLPVAVTMSTSKYSHFCILKILKYGTENSKTKLVDALFGNIVKLCCNNISSKIIDSAYLIANTKQKNYMRQEFYSDLYKNSKDDSIQKLQDTYADTPHMKSAMLGSVKANLEHIANKKLVDNSLVHAVILEYLNECDEENLEETITFFYPMIPMLVTTKEGCKAATILFHKSSLKNRRAIIKSIKDHLVKICTHEQGHIFILAILNSLDDTKAMKKAIYDFIHPELKTIVSNQWGRRIFNWFISPASTKSFHPKFIAEIDESLKYGKKEKELRRKEILLQIEEPIAEAINENPEFWLSSRQIGLITSEILNTIGPSNFVKASTALASIICNPTWSVEEYVKKTEEDEIKKEATEKEDTENSGFIEKNLIPGIEEAGLHFCLRKILKHDLERQKLPECKTFGSILVENLSEDTVKHWLSINRACFVLLLIVENNPQHVTEAIRNLIRPHSHMIAESGHVGGKLLLEKLKLCV